MIQEGDLYAVRENDKAQIGKGCIPEHSWTGVDMSNLCQDMTLDFLNIQQIFSDILDWFVYLEGM